MRKLTAAALVILCSFILIFTLVGCDGSKTPAPEEIEDPTKCDPQVNSDESEYIEVELCKGIYIDSKVMCDWGEGWQDLPYGDMFGGEFAALADDILM